MKNAASCKGKYTGKKKSKKVRNLGRIDYIFITKMRVNMQVMSFLEGTKLVLVILYSDMFLTFPTLN